MFPEHYRNETQMMITVYSSDQENDGDVLGAVGASTALMISDIPFDGPIAEVRVGRNDGQFIINPTFSQLENSDLDVIVAGRDPVATDATACRVMGIDPQEIEHIRKAHEKGRGHLDAIQVLGERLENVTRMFKRS